jgi:glycosyltransferase involved in cell wall biosynthesis/SAM-dependent methyltransferase
MHVLQMRVLQIHKTFYTRGGADTFFFKTCGLLSEHGHEVAHFSTAHAKNRPSPYSEYFVGGFNDEDVSRLSLARKAKAFVQGIYSLEARNQLAQLVEDFKPDVAHAHSINYQLSPSIFDVFRNSRIPLVVTLHDYHIICGAGTLYTRGAVCERCRGGRHYNLLLHSCYWNRPASLMACLSHYVHDARGSWDCAAKLVVPSRFLGDKLIEFGVVARRIAQLPIFIDFPDSAQTDARTDDNGGAGDYVLYFGRLDTNKGVKVLIKAMEQVDCKLLLIGEGPLSAQMERWCAERPGRAERIPFVSSRQRLQEYIRRSRFCVVPSLWYENQPAAILESYAMGKPVIGSRLGGIPELIEDGQTGLLAEAGNAGDWRKKIRYLLDRPELCREWGRNGQGKLSQQFSRESHYSRLMAIYESAMQDSAIHDSAVHDAAAICHCIPPTDTGGAVSTDSPQNLTWREAEPRPSCDKAEAMKMKTGEDAAMPAHSSEAACADTGHYYQGVSGRKYFDWQNRNAASAARVLARKFQPYIRPSDNVLDFGCGGGHLLGNLGCAARVGVDINPAARAAAAQLGIECHESLDDLCDNAFRVIISNHALEHVEFPIATLRALRRRLAPSGTLILCLPIDDWRTQRDYRAEDVNRHLYTWTPQLLGNTLCEAGFRPSDFSLAIWTHWFPGATRYGTLPESFLPKFLVDGLCWILATVLKRRQLLAIASKTM